MALPESDLKLLLKALDFASRKHTHQRRKDKEESPYINHPIALASILCNEGRVTDVDTICGALLHDTIEDTETTPEELYDEFGPAIRDIVVELTDDKSLPKAERKRLQIVHAPHASPKAKLVKLADKIANLRDVVTSPPADWDKQRRLQYFEWAKQVVDQIRGVHPGLEAMFDQWYERRLQEL